MPNYQRGVPAIGERSLSTPRRQSPRAASTLRRVSGQVAIAVCIATILATLALDLAAVRQLGGLRQWARKADFVIILTGAAVLADGHPAQLYDERAQTVAQADVLEAGGLRGSALLPYDHPPPEALIVRALQVAGWSVGACFLLWTVLSVGALVGALGMMVRWWVRPEQRALAALAAVSFFPIGAGLLLGQSAAFVLLGWAGATALLRRGHDGWAGVALALAALKPQTLPVLLIALIVARRYRALVTFGAVLGGGTIAVMPVLGLDWPYRYLTFLIRYAQAPVGPGNPALDQGWGGVFQKTLGEGPAAHAAAAVAMLLSLFLVAWLWRRPERTKAGADHDSSWDRRWALTLIVAVLTDPHVLPHDLALTLVPALLLASQTEPFRLEANIWLWIGWAIGLEAVLYRGSWPPLAAFWLAGSAGWLCWTISQPMIRTERATAATDAAL